MPMINLLASPANSEEECLRPNLNLTQSGKFFVLLSMLSTEQHHESFFNYGIRWPLFSYLRQQFSVLINYLFTLDATPSQAPFTHCVAATLYHLCCKQIYLNGFTSPREICFFFWYTKEVNKLMFCFQEQHRLLYYDLNW